MGRRGLWGSPCCQGELFFLHGEPCGLFPLKGCSGAVFPTHPPITSSSTSAVCSATDACAPLEAEDSGYSQSWQAPSLPSNPLPGWIQLLVAGRSCWKLLIHQQLWWWDRSQLPVLTPSSAHRALLLRQQLLAEEQNRAEEATSKTGCGLKEIVKAISLLSKRTSTCDLLWGCLFWLRCACKEKSSPEQHAETP